MELASERAAPMRALVGGPVLVRSFGCVSRSTPPLLLVATALVACALGGCGAARFGVVRGSGHAPTIEIRQLHLSWSNVFLVRGASGAVLVDSGSPGDWDALNDALTAEGLGPTDLRLVILTHAHADHAGLAAQLQQAGVPIAMGRGDAEMAARGTDGELLPTSILGDLLRPFVDFPYTPFTADVLVDTSVDLAAYGVRGARIESLPGHTAGSLIVWIGLEEAIVGDEMLGGIGGELGAGIAGEHFYQADAHQNHCNVQRLLDLGVQRFYVGHGGPIERPSVVGWREQLWRRESATCP
jgi:hydroxyacylglutathione hydrolase